MGDKLIVNGYRPPLFADGSGPLIFFHRNHRTIEVLRQHGRSPQVYQAWDEYLDAEFSHESLSETESESTVDRLKDLGATVMSGETDPREFDCSLFGGPMPEPPPHPDYSGRSSREKMALLARSFHVLVKAPGTDPFDPEALWGWAQGLEDGATRDSALFVLNVWNTPGGGISRDITWPDFNVVNAFTRWDYLNRAAFLAWANDPWRP